MRKMSRVHKPHRWQWLWLIPAALLVWWPLWFLFMGALMSQEELRLTIGPALGLGTRIYRLAPVARLADARTVADPAVGYAAVFCHVLEQHRPVCSPGGREPAGGRACRLGNQPASLSRAQYGSGALHRSDAIALPGNHGAQLSDIAPIWPAGHAVGHHFTGHLFYISGIYHGARL